MEDKTFSQYTIDTYKSMANKRVRMEQKSNQQYDKMY